MITSISKYLCLLAVASAGFLNQANAQRRGGDNRGGGGGNWGGRSEQRSTNNGGGFNRGGNWGNAGNTGGTRTDQRRDMDRSTQNFPDRQANRRSFDPQQNQNGGGFTQRNNNNFDQRNNSTQRSNTFDRRNNSFDRQRTTNVYNGNRYGTSRTIINNRYGGSYGRRYDTRSYSGYRYYAPRRYAYIGAPRYSVVPHSWISIRFGGYPYYYNSGLFYSYYGGYYSPVFAPIGIHINMLPVGYYPFYIGPSRYYYYSGVYYRDYDGGQYEVVDAPLGAQVSSLPKGATVALVNGEKFYEFNGTYYREETNSRNEVVYTVVGKNGEINNSDAGDDVSNNPPPSSGLHMGDIVPDLPEGSRSVTINGESLFLSPDNLYFKQVVNGNETAYQVVGNAVSNN